MLKSLLHRYRHQLGLNAAGSNVSISRELYEQQKVILKLNLIELKSKQKHWKIHDSASQNIWACQEKLSEWKVFGFNEETWANWLSLWLGQIRIARCNFVKGAWLFWTSAMMSAERLQFWVESRSNLGLCYTATPPLRRYTAVSITIPTLQLAWWMAL